MELHESLTWTRHTCNCVRLCLDLQRLRILSRVNKTWYAAFSVEVDETACRSRWLEHYNYDVDCGTLVSNLFKPPMVPFRRSFDFVTRALELNTGKWCFYGYKAWADPVREKWPGSPLGCDIVTLWHDKTVVTRSGREHPPLPPDDWLPNRYL